MEHTLNYMSEVGAIDEAGLVALLEHAVPKQTMNGEINYLCIEDQDDEIDNTIKT